MPVRPTPALWRQTICTIQYVHHNKCTHTLHTNTQVHIQEHPPTPTHPPTPMLTQWHSSCSYGITHPDQSHHALCNTYTHAGPVTHQWNPFPPRHSRILLTPTTTQSHSHTNTHANLQWTTRGAELSRNSFLTCWINLTIEWGCCGTPWSGQAVKKKCFSFKGLADESAVWWRQESWGDAVL